jgi:hypothetical protein
MAGLHSRGVAGRYALAVAVGRLRSAAGTARKRQTAKADSTVRSRASGSRGRRSIAFKNWVPALAGTNEGSPQVL